MTFAVATRVDENGRACTKCGDYKLWSEFYVAAGRSFGHTARCKDCIGARVRKRWSELTPEQREHRRQWNRAYVGGAGQSGYRRAQLKHHRGITPEQYDWLVQQQDGKCYLCRKAEAINNRGGSVPQRLAIDHDHGCPDHSPKKCCPRCIRALLCLLCNRRLIGYVESVPALQIWFTDYLTRRPLLAPDAPISEI